MYPPSLETNSGSPYHPEGAALQELEQTRAQFLGLNDLQKDMLDPYAVLLMGEDMLPDAGHMRPSEYLATSDDQTLGEFLARHHGYLDMQRADAYVAGGFEHFKGSYVDRLETGVQEGWVSDDARDLFDYIRKVTLEVGDIRESRLEWKIGQFFGYSNTMMVAQAAGMGDYRTELVGDIRDSLPHELSHRFSRWLPRWASESFAEQLGLVVQHGDPDVFHADMRAHERSKYYNGESILMHTLLTGGPNQNPELPRMALRAFTSAGPDSTEWQQFHAALDAAWGTKDAFQKVSAYAEGLEKSVAAEHEDWTNWQVEPEAMTQATLALTYNQTAIFGREYKPSGRHRREEPSRRDRQSGRHRRA